MPSLFSEYSLLQMDEMGSLLTVTISSPGILYKFARCGQHGPSSYTLILSRRLTLIERSGRGTSDELTLLRSAGD